MSQQSHKAKKSITKGLPRMGPWWSGAIFVHRDSWPGNKSRGLTVEDDGPKVGVVALVDMDYPWCTETMRLIQQ